MSERQLQTDGDWLTMMDDALATDDPTAPGEELHENGAGSAEPASSSGWYYLTGEAPQGPYPLEQLLRPLSTGALAADTLVWAPGMRDWQPATAVPALAGRVASPASDEAVAWSSSPRPWHRWLARLIDLFVAGFVTGALIEMIDPGSPLFESDALLTVVVMAVWVILESVLLHAFGTTPGKALFNIRLRRTDGRMLKIDEALTRSLRVWVLGLGLGLPLLNLIAMALAHGRLKREGQTSWDEKGQLSVEHGPVGPGRVTGIVLTLLFSLVMIALSSGA